MTDREKVVRAVETCFDSWIDKHRNMGLDLHEVERMKRDALELLKEQEPRELTKQEWEDWKKDSKRDPVCFMYIGDGTPLWALKPEDINEVLYLMGKIKLFTKKPLKEQKPIKPIDETCWDYTYGRCGHCKAPLPALEGMKSKFCWMCGKAVKWDE